LLNNEDQFNLSLDLETARDLLQAARWQITRHWWNFQRPKDVLCTPEELMENDNEQNA
jgi:hypothetical protein